MTKMLDTHFLGILVGPKGYGEVLDRYIRKVTKFGLLRIIIFRSI